MSLTANPGQLRAIELLRCPQRHTLLYGGARCLSGDAILDGHTKTIAELAAIGDDVLLLTSYGQQRVRAPFRKGMDVLWTFVTAGDRTVTVTDDHQFWNGGRWIKAAEVAVGDQVAVRSSETCLQASTLEPCRATSPEGGRRCSRKAPDSSNRCSQHTHQCDGPLRLAEDNGQASDASQFGVAAHSRAGRTFERSGSDNPAPHRAPRAQECSPVDPWSCRSSTSGVELDLHDGGQPEAFLAEQTFEPSPHLSTTRRQSAEQSFLALSYLLLGRDFVLSDQFESPHAYPLDTPATDGYTLATIVSITRAPKQPFYTVHVPVCGHYFANGILHHNSGKTFLIVRAIIVRAMRGERSRHAILRFRGNAARSSIALDTLPTVMRACFPELRITEHRQDGFFEFPNGSQIWIGGLDDKARVEKILGQEHCTIYLNECSQIPYSSVLVARTRLAQQVEGLRQRAYYDLNPGGSSHWTNREFLEHRDPISGKPLPDPDNFKFTTINTEENSQNLAEDFLVSMRNLPEKQRKRFYEGRFVPEVDGALWTYDLIERCRIDDLAGLPPEDLCRRLGITQVVVAVDPSGAAAKEEKRSDEIGIAVCGLSPDGKGYLLEDCTVRDGPHVWGRVAVNAYRKWQANRIVAEINYGGAMVEFTVRVADPDVPIRVVTASRGKHVRADPVSALYENGRIFHVGRFADLEDQLVNFSSSGYVGERSPDRADAAIWGFTDLMVDSESSYDASLGWVASLGQFSKGLSPTASIGSW